jgi:hypothetical protein
MQHKSNWQLNHLQPQLRHYHPRHHRQFRQPVSSTRRRQLFPPHVVRCLVGEPNSYFWLREQWENQSCHDRNSGRERRGYNDQRGAVRDRTQADSRLRPQRQQRQRSQQREGGGKNPLPYPSGSHGSIESNVMSNNHRLTDHSMHRLRV